MRSEDNAKKVKFEWWGLTLRKETSWSGFHVYWRTEPSASKFKYLMRVKWCWPCLYIFSDLVLAITLSPLSWHRAGFSSPSRLQGTGSWQASLRNMAGATIAAGPPLLGLNYDFLRKQMKAVQSAIINNSIAASPLLPLSQLILLTKSNSSSLTAAWNTGFHGLYLVCHQDLNISGHGSTAGSSLVKAWWD